MTHKLALRHMLPAAVIPDPTGITQAPPFDRPAITARVELVDEHGGRTTRDVPGRAHAWTRLAVYAELHLSAGDIRHAWLHADLITRRDTPPTDTD